MDECSDPEHTWYPQRLVCYKTMELAATERRWASLHEAMPWHDGTFSSWAKERDAAHPCHFSDGVRIWVSDVDYDPDGTWLSGRGAVDREEDDGGEQQP